MTVNQDSSRIIRQGLDNIAAAIMAAAKPTPDPTTTDPDEPGPDDTPTVEDIAADLWEADHTHGYTSTPARTFHTDTTSTQDRYRLLAHTAINGPDPKDPKETR
jgi:hypothetical protein